MKFRTTKKDIINNYYTIKVSFCGLQHLLKYSTPIAYCSGVYGWNCDIYTFGKYAIVTGYRPFGEFKPAYELVKKYDEKAEQIIDKNKLDKLIKEFIEEVFNNEQ